MHGIQAPRRTLQHEMRDFSQNLTFRVSAIEIAIPARERLQSIDSKQDRINIPEISYVSTPNNPPLPMLFPTPQSCPQLQSPSAKPPYTDHETLPPSLYPCPQV